MNYGQRRCLEVGTIDTIMERATEYSHYGVPFGPHFFGECRVEAKFTHDHSMRGPSGTGEIRMYKINHDWLMAVHVPDRALMVLGAIERANYDYSGWGTAQDLISGANPAVLLYEGRAIPFLACAFGDFVGRCKVSRDVSVFMKFKDHISIELHLGCMNPSGTYNLVFLGEILWMQARSGVVWHLRPAEVERALNAWKAAERQELDTRSAPLDVAATCRRIDEVAAIPPSNDRGRDRPGIAAVACLFKQLAREGIAHANGSCGPRFRAGLFWHARLACSLADRTVRYGFSHFAAHSSFVVIQGQKCTVSLEPPKATTGGAGGLGGAEEPRHEVGHVVERENHRADGLGAPQEPPGMPAPEARPALPAPLTAEAVETAREMSPRAGSTPSARPPTTPMPAPGSARGGCLLWPTGRNGVGPRAGSPAPALSSGARPARSSARALAQPAPSAGPQLGRLAPRAARPALALSSGGSHSSGARPAGPLAPVTRATRSAASARLTARLHRPDRPRRRPLDPRRRARRALLPGDVPRLRRQRPADDPGRRRCHPRPLSLSRGPRRPRPQPPRPPPPGPGRAARGSPRRGAPPTRAPSAGGRRSPTRAPASRAGP